MHLLNEQIRKIVKNRPQRKQILAGKSHQERLQFHSETILEKQNLNNAYHNFINWIGSETPELLSKQKFDRFKQLIRTPIQTIELTESIYSRLYRVFFAQDSYFNYKFTDDSLNADWEEFRDADFWQTKGFEAMQTAIDSVWVVDLPEEQLTEFPEARDMLVNISDVIAIENDAYNNCYYVLFNIGELLYVYDDTSFRVFTYDDKLQLLADIPHGLGYCPARMMWSKNLIASNYINKESPITKELSDLDWLLFHLTSKRYLDLGAAYPITVAYELDEDVGDNDVTENEQRTAGEKPKGNKILGPGSFLEVPAPRSGEDSDLMRNPIWQLNPDTKVLDWHVKEEKRLAEKIFKSVVGTDQEVKNDVAKNETQVESSYESQSTVIYRIKRNFEIIHKFADETKCRLRYGERFIGCEIDYGTRFYLKSAEDLQEEYSDAKKSGANEIIITSLSENIINTKYREDNYNKTRAKIILDIDPLPNRTLEEAINIFKEGGIDKINFIIKSNLFNFIRRFEREVFDIVRYGELISYDRKINGIIDEFKKYANERSSELPGVS